MNIETTDDDLGSRLSVSIERHWIQSGTVRLHVRAAGPSDGPLVVLLHGFPEFWYGWRHQIAPLVEAGYRVVAPDQRGYNWSSAPSSVAAYDLDLLTTDVCRLINAADREQAHVVGHDWGAMVGWHLAMTHPERIDRLGILNVPHPTVFWRTLCTSPRQLLRSLYVFFFQLPGIPEWLLGRNDGQGLLWLLRQSADADTFTDQELRAYRRAWRRPGRVRGMLNWYRAAVRRAVRTSSPAEQIEVPTLVLWGARDNALSRQMAAPSADRCTDGRLVMIEDATHWVQHDARERVNRHLLDHLGAA